MATNNKQLKLKILKTFENAEIALPAYQSAGAAGFDLSAHLKEPLKIAVGNIVLVPTGLIMAIPSGYEGEIRPRSGLASKFGLTLINSPGTIDSDYRGEILLPIINLGKHEYIIKNGERVAQMLIKKVEKVKIVWASALDETKRGPSGFGST